MRRRLFVLSLLLGLLALMATAPLLAQAPPETPVSSAPSNPPIDLQQRLKIHPRLLKTLAENPEQLTRTMVEMSARPDLAGISDAMQPEQRRRATIDSLTEFADGAQAAALATLADQVGGGHAAEVKSLWAFGGIASQADETGVLALAELPDVRLVRPELEFHLDSPPTGSSVSPDVSGETQWNISQVRADLVWNALRLDGAGVIVANLDTGVDWQHPALMTHYVGYDPHGLYDHSCAWFDAIGYGATYPVDNNGHGTHTMGTAVGQGGIGVAPGASWMAVRAFDNSGYALESWLHAGYQWLLDPGSGCEPPDIVNSSWSNNYGQITTFRPDVQALRAAGIFAPFSAGNNGPSSSSVGSPASYPEAFSVGAVSDEDVVGSFSGRGPATWFGSYDVKPEVSAPGINVRSSLPGGGYGFNTGTSMAAPHVSGLGALMLQADNTLTLGEIENVMEQTAVPLGAAIPNNDTGYGRIDAYAAVSALLDAGVISGTVRDSATQLPISQATVAATPAFSGTAARVTSGSAGEYALALAPDLYMVTASAFGYFDKSYPLTVYTNTTVVRDFDMSSLPTGTLNGRVLGGGSVISSVNAPVVDVLGAPVSTTADANGYFSTSLPEGTYTLTVTSLGYRVAVTTSVTIWADTTTTANFDLVAAPKILLVDGGAWYYESTIQSYAAALDELLYAYDVWAIADAFGDVPTSADLAAYDVVIWSSPEDSPGYVGADTALREFLNGGGMLFLSGQNVAYYDDYYLPGASYLVDMLKATYVKDNANIFALSGASAGILNGLSFSISGAGGADNQVSPDEVSLNDPGAGLSTVSYDGDGSAGLQIGTCLPHRSVFLSFGLEAITDAAVRTEVISRSMAFFSAGPATTGAEWLPTTSSTIGPVGSTVTHALRLRSVAETGLGDTFDLVATGNDWATSLSTPSVSLAPCASTTVTISVQIPATATWAAIDNAGVTAESRTYPGQVVSAGIQTESPAPVLLVDDDKFYDVQGYYTHALVTKGIPYQLWNNAVEGGSPLTDTLAMYPIVLWVSAYDWTSPLTPEEENRLAAYLGYGGALYFNGQEYLYSTTGPDDFAHSYLGVYSYTEDFTSTAATGVYTSPVGAWLGPADVALPYRNYSDALTPSLSARPAMVNQAGLPNSLTNEGSAWRTAFFAFNPDGLPQPTGDHLIQRVVGWLSWLGGSQVEADRAMVREAETITYTVTLLNDGWQAMDPAAMTATFPSDLVPVPGSVQGGASWDAGHNAFVWSGALAQGESRTFSYRADVAGSMPDGSVLSHTVWMGYDGHRIVFDRVESVFVNYPILSSSTFTASSQPVSQGDWLTFTLQAANTGFGAAQASVENPLPQFLAVSAGDIHVSSGDVGLLGRRINWSIPLSESQSAVLTYTGWLTRIPPSFRLSNYALVNDGLGSRVLLEVDVAVNPQSFFLPVTMKD